MAKRSGASLSNLLEHKVVLGGFLFARKKEEKKLASQKLKKLWWLFFISSFKLNVDLPPPPCVQRTLTFQPLASVHMTHIRALFSRKRLCINVGVLWLDSGLNQWTSGSSEGLRSEYGTIILYFLSRFLALKTFSRNLFLASPFIPRG